MQSVRSKERPYGRYAFLNPYNLSLFAGGVALGFLSGHTWLVVVTCAAEAMWLIFAPDSEVLRRIWFDRAFAREAEAEAAERCAKKVQKLAPADAQRLVRLAQQKEIIERLAKDNPSLAVDLLAGELAKLDALLEDFVDLGVAAWRAELHAQTFDFGAMRRSWQTYESQVAAHAPGDRRREVAEKNLDVLRRRRARYDDLGRSIQIARGQMELIEQTFRLLADEILTMASPTELGSRIDELRVAVDAVRETTTDDFEAMYEEELRHEEGHR
jgi:hypothetical protein